MTSVTVNGRRYDVDLPDDTPLLWALRDELGLTGTKFGCGMALCGACTVHIDGQPVRSCVTPISAVGGKQGHHHRGDRRRNGGPGAAGRVGRHGRAAVRLLPGRARSWRPPRCSSATPKPSDAEIDEAMTGNICRCGTYVRIRAAIKQAAAQGAVR